MKYIVQYSKSENINQIIELKCEINKNLELSENEIEIDKKLFDYLSSVINIEGNTVYFNTIDNLIKYKIYKKKKISNNENQLETEFAYLCSFVDSGDERFLTGLHMIPQVNYFGYNHKFIKVTYEIYKYLSQNITFMQTMWVKLKDKKLKFIDNKNQIIFLHLELSDEDKFEYEKNNLIQKIYYELFKEIDGTTMYNFFNFIIYNTELMSHGIFLTEENRDEQYIKIINESDSENCEIQKKAEKKISVLANYLDAYGYLVNHFSIQKKFEKLKEEIFDCETLKELNDIKFKIHEKLQ